MSNPIVTENALTGSTGWQFGTVATTEIQSYADQTSLDTGSTINFFVSTQVAATTYTMRIYRLGYYGGTGGCLKATSSGRVGVAQGYWNASNTTLTSCPTAIIDAGTHNLEAGWTSTDSWAVPVGACTGVYLAQFTDANGKQCAVTFVVRGNASADYVLVRPFTTDAAYNDWGGYSLYTNATVGVKVSFNRPNVNYGGGAFVLYFELQVIHWMESQGYNMAYLSDVDVHTNASQLLTHKAYISLGHDEYWTKAMRNGVEAAITAGVNCAFLGANACYWQCRFENDNAGNPNRTVVCYKVQTKLANLSLDPQFGVDNTIVTSNWRDAVIGRPENKMVGIQFSSLGGGSPRQSFAWTVDPAQSSNGVFLAGTGLVPGTTYGSQLVGYEWDKLFPGGPSNLQILGTTQTIDENSKNDVSHTTYYIAASGALIFATGSLQWSWCLNSYRWDGTTPAPIAGMQALFAALLLAMIQPKNQVGFSKFMLHT